MNTSRTWAESPQAAESTQRAESTRRPRGRSSARRRLGPLLLVVGVAAVRPAFAERIVSVGGTVTEIVYALGASDALVGVDSSSVHPPEAGKLPQVGYQRTLSAEGVLSLSPTLVLVTPESGPPAAIEHLRAAGLRVVQIPTGADVEAARAAIRAVAATLDRQARGEDLVRALDADLERARAVAAASTSRPRVLFVYARGAGTAMVSGRGTAADEMIRLAGAVNAVTDYDGFRPLTAEGVVAAAPDVVLVPTRGLDSLGGKAALLAQPGLSLTPAARGERVVAMDDLYLLGFGPRTGRALADLARALHGDAVSRARDPIGQDIGAATVRERLAPIQCAADRSLTVAAPRASWIEARDQCRDRLVGQRLTALWRAAPLSIQGGASRRAPDRVAAVARRSEGPR